MCFEAHVTSYEKSASERRDMPRVLVLLHFAWRGWDGRVHGWTK
jgi:hypothetical protein